VLQGEHDQRRIFAKGVEELTTPARLREDESDRARHHDTAQPLVAPACAGAANQIGDQASGGSVTPVCDVMRP
jgi:hypothetical protein